ncbi:glutamate ABC transporter substrate-binding protein [Streptacidiphilus monticola]|uniref:Glutamate ABC transporter substrate-binding protein n=1 Tax=Streptacidiphilus monticola TaxID=2161674 RepID=A0ABW1FUU0_9ACTN
MQRIRQRGRLIAGIDTNSFNWGYRNPQTGALTGFDIDLVHAIAKALLGDPNAVDFLAVPTAKRVEALQDGTVDIVVRTMTINCERAKQVSFSAPYFTAGQQVVAPVADQGITGFDSSLKGKRVCAASGSTAWQNFVAENTLGATPVPVANQLDCLVQMQLGNVDATVTDNALGAGQVAQDPSVHLVGGPLDTEYYGVAVKLGSDDLVRRVNAVLEQYAATQWQAEYGKWLKQSMGGRDAVPPAPRYRD